MNNPIKNYFEKISRSEKFFFNRLFNRFVYFLIFFLAAASLVVLIVFLSIPNQNQHSELLWIGLSFIIFILIFYYIYQFIRRKLKYKFEALINFKWLYNQNLLDQKIINASLNEIDVYNQFFIELHVNLMKNRYENANLGNQFESYSFKDTNNDDCLFSICNIKKYQNGLFKKNKNILQLIIKNETKKIQLDDLFISFSDAYKNIKMVNNLSKQDTLNKYHLFTNANQMDQKQILKLDPLLIKMQEQKLDISILIWKNQLYFIYETEHPLNFEQQNWFDQENNSFIQKYDLFWQEVKDFFKYSI